MSARGAAFAPALFHLAAVAAVGVLAWTAYGHLSYYSLPAVERPYHTDHPALRSSGSAGLSYGIAASTLMVLNLSYLVRKRLLAWSWLGNLRGWMAFHVCTGVTAAALVLLHSAALPRSALGIYALLGLAVVVLSGLIGRYIYAHVPRSLEGRELEIGELRRELRDFRGRLEAAGLSADLLEDPPGRDLPEAKSLLGRLRGLVAGDRAIRRAYRDLRRAIRTRPDLRPLARRILPPARRYLKERQWLARYGELRGLMGSWRFLHRWLAIVMIAVVFFHVAVALRFGDLVLPRVPF